ncbi:hypothetical protein AB1Y20_023444 [Prymnesium parvum]|uniref:Glycoside hydrolase family 5 domain-containing protein n=1 Tax=Prymnesium parvum TaxID=97485 RepID=A0AB34JGA1_PRYPA
MAAARRCRLPTAPLRPAYPPAARTLRRHSRTLLLALLPPLCRGGACEPWCSQYTCDQPRCAACVDGCGRPFSPPPPPPRPPSAPHSPAVPLNTVGVRRADYWTDGEKIFTNALTGAAQQLRLKGASWFGLEGDPCYPGGATQAAIADNMAFLREHRFNAVRVPLALDAVLAAAAGGRAACQGPDGLFYTFNPDFSGLGYMEMLGLLVRHARDHGILVMLDVHVDRAGVWPDAGRAGLEGRRRLLAGWARLAARFCDAEEYWNVFAADLKNEPHGMYWGPGEGAAYPPHERWDALAAAVGNEVHRACPRWLVFVEGVGHCMVEVAEAHDDLPHPCAAPSAAGQDVAVPTWWGENLQAALEYPVALASRQKLVYSPHVYGPSVYPQPYFWQPDFPANLPPIWRAQWAHISRRRAFPVVIGEWGGRYTGADKVWQDAFVGFLADPRNAIAGSFYWAINPNSADTGGLLSAWGGGGGGAGRPEAAKLQMLSVLAATYVPTATTLPPLHPSPAASPAPPAARAPLAPPARAGGAPPPPPPPAGEAREARPSPRASASPPARPPPSGRTGRAHSAVLLLALRSAVGLLLVAALCEAWRLRRRCPRRRQRLPTDDDGGAQESVPSCEQPRHMRASSASTAVKAGGPSEVARAGYSY